MRNRIARTVSVAIVSAAFLIGAASMTSAHADTYPSRPITMVVPFPAGGGLDFIARLIAPRMGQLLGQPIVIENVPGAAGSVGVGRAVHSPADGYTLSMGITSTHVFNGATHPLKYDLLKDLDPVSLISSTPQIIEAKKSVPANDLKGLVAWLKANPNKALMGTAGVGSAGHIAGAFLEKETGTQFQFVPYRGLAPAMQGLLGGQVDLLIDVPAVALPQIQAGTIKGFAVMGKKRLASAPNVPTVDEVGLPGLYAPSWYAMWVPHGTPPEIVAKLNAALVATLADPAIRARFAEEGHEIFPREQQTPDALRAYQQAEIQKWWPIIRTAGISVE